MVDLMSEKEVEFAEVEGSYRETRPMLLSLHDCHRCS